MDLEASKLGVLPGEAYDVGSFFVADRALRILDADRAFANLLGITREDVERGCARLPLGDTDEQSELAKRLAALAPGDIYQRQVELGGPDGRARQATLTLFPRRDDQRRVTHFFGSIHEAMAPVGVDCVPAGPRTDGEQDLARQLQSEIAHRQRSERRLGRLLEFNSLLASVNHAISVHEDEVHLLQSICDLATQHAHLALTYVARPNAQGRFEFLAASGRIEAVATVTITTDERSPSGRGSVGRAWRDGNAQFNNAYAAEPTLARWREHARAFGLRSNAALPLFRRGTIWAVLAVYHEEENVFDADLRNLLEQIARDVSSGLDRIDLLAEDKRNRALRESLLTNALVGIVMTRGRRIVDANAHFASMLGYRDVQDLVGRETRALYADEASFERVKVLYPQLYETGSAQLTSASLVRQGGDLIACDLSANMTYEVGKRLVVWTVVDVTARDALQQRIAFESLHDPLTGLANRRSLNHDLPRMLARAERSGHVVAVGMLDLDDFKQVNDTLGHDAGDALLRALTERLQSRLRASDLLVRLGGDEFVIVLDDLDAPDLADQLASALDRLHQAVESPFIVGHGQRAEVGMTMGIAIFPGDAKESDALIRQADAAMYQCKQHKHDRSSWWRVSSAGAGLFEGEQDNDPFGTEAARLLDKAKVHFVEVGTAFAEKFYRELQRDEAPEAVLRTLTEQEMQVLLRRQAAHLGFLLHPQTTREAIVARARRLGQVHALCGVGGAWLSRAQGLYRKLLAEQLNHVPLRARERLSILHTAEERLQEDFQAELDAGALTTAAYLDVLATPLPAQGSLWVDASHAGIAELSALPGMQATLLLRLTSNGAFAVEGSAGPQARALADLLQKPGWEPVLDPTSERGQALTARAWRSLQVERSASFVRDTRYAAWQGWAPHVENLAIRSAISIPVLNAAGQGVVVLGLFGAYPNQFESDLMRQFSRSLKHRWEQIWSLCAAPAPVIAQDQAREYRNQLLNGGLRMFVQPVIDLKSRRLVKVEALARLVMPDGVVIAPGVFLPLLGSAELDRLFSLGLDQALGYLASWDAQGMEIAISVNLPPSTLLDGGCVEVVDRSLRHHGIAPHRLTLEILESQGIETREQDQAIEQLRRLGVKLAMDDLGSGYSSLRRLSLLPFDAIKIDQSLLLQIRSLPVQTLSLVSTIVQMGRDFELEVVAEGLEDDAVIEAVTVLGAGSGQGYGLGRPMPAEELVQWKQARPRAAPGGQIRHVLGALAYHWQYMHGVKPPHPSAVEACPLTGFFAQQGLEHSEAAAWHAQIHAGRNVATASAQLLQWLVAQVQMDDSERQAVNCGAQPGD